MAASITINEVIRFLEVLAPRSLQEGYDNSGLLCGSGTWTVQGVLVALDCTEAVVAEAQARGCNLIVAHHPILFRGLKSLTGATYVERTLIQAIKQDIAIYAIHTNLDHVAGGVNAEICRVLGLANCRILKPRTDVLMKLTVFSPVASTSQVVAALHEAGAGELGNYSHCSFQVSGTGSFLPGEGATPAIGQVRQLAKVAEDRVEVIFPSWLYNTVIQALKSSHPYEEPAYFVHRLENSHAGVGAGMIGEWPEPKSLQEALKHIKMALGAPVLRFTRPVKAEVSRVAVCGGTGSFLLRDAQAAGADIFITSDVKYHEFFDAEERLVLVDLGHYEGEVHTKSLLVRYLTKKFTTFAINFCETDTNPISYL